MAYNDNSIGIRIGAAANQAAIVVGQLLTSGLITMLDGPDWHRDLTKAFYNNMTDIQAEVEDGVSAAAPKAAPAAPVVTQTTFNAEAALSSEMGAVAVADAPTIPQETVQGVKILNEQHGPVPDWLFTNAAAKGVTEVWDNRDKLATSPKSPWFRSSKKHLDEKGGQIPFWPPRG